MKKILVIEGRTTIGGGQIITKEICDALKDEYLLHALVPGNNSVPTAILLKDICQSYFEYKEYSRGKKKLIDYYYFIKNLKIIRIIRKIIKSERPHLIYIQHASMLPLVLLSLLGLKTKIIVHIHVVYSDCRVRWFMNKMLKSKKITKILGVSNYTLSQLEKPLLNKSYLLYNPVKLYDCLKNEKRTRNIAIVGDVTPLKGHEVLFKAISMLPLGYKIHVIGNVIDKQYKAHLLTDFPNVDVLFTGMVSDIPHYMKEHSIDITTIATTAVFETFSLAMVESWSMGIPTIATNDFGMKELVNRFLPQYSEFILFEYRNSEDLKNKIINLEIDEILYDKISRDCRQVVKKYFNEKCFPEKLKKIINS